MINTNISFTVLLALAISAGHASAESSSNLRGLSGCDKKCDLNNPCKKGGRQFYFEHCNKGKFIQCDNLGGCYEKRCPEGTVWNQGLLTCTHEVEDECSGCTTGAPTNVASAGPSVVPTRAPVAEPSPSPSEEPTAAPSTSPSTSPSPSPAATSVAPTTAPAEKPRLGLTAAPRKIYETVEFTVKTICGSRCSVQDRLESAFLAFFEEDFEECESDRDVEALVLVEFEEAESCSDDDSSRGHRALAEGRRLQNDHLSRGVFNRQSTCRRCRRRLEGLPGHGSIGSSQHVLGTKTEYSADLVQALRDEGFDDVEEAEIISIKEVDCSSDSRDCTSTSRRRGACCGVSGCACNLPSESLCEANDFCVEVAHPFDAYFCEDFGDTSDCGLDEYSGSRGSY